MATTPAGIYPLSTQDGRDIPFDIIKPLSLIFYTLAANVVKTINIPTTVKLAYVYSRVDCLVRFNATALPYPVVQDTVYSDAIFIPAATPVSVVVNSGVGSILPFTSGNIYISFVEQWASLSQPIQSNVG